MTSTLTLMCSMLLRVFMVSPHLPMSTNRNHGATCFQPMRVSGPTGWRAPTLLFTQSGPLLRHGPLLRGGTPLSE